MFKSVCIVCIVQRVHFLSMCLNLILVHIWCPQRFIAKAEPPFLPYTRTHTHISKYTYTHTHANTHTHNQQRKINGTVCIQVSAVCVMVDPTFSAKSYLSLALICRSASTPKLCNLCPSTNPESSYSIVQPHTPMQFSKFHVLIPFIKFNWISLCALDCRSASVQQHELALEVELNKRTRLLQKLRKGADKVGVGDEWVGVAGGGVGRLGGATLQKWKWRWADFARVEQRLL